MADEMEAIIKMSNLGAYQWLTTTAKKVGGPKKLVMIIAGSGVVAGVVVYKGSEFLIKKVVKEVKKRTDKEKLPEIADTKLYTVTVADTSNDGLMFKTGDEFRILETDKDAVLIEKVGDSNNPYFVSEGLLRNISNYN